MTPDWRPCGALPPPWCANAGDPTRATSRRSWRPGSGPRQVLELVLIVSTKTLSNYINHVAETPVDPAMEKFAWQPPAMRSAAQ